MKFLRQTSSNYLLKSLILSLILIWCFGIFFEFFNFYSSMALESVPFIKQAYSLVCHQESEKLIYFDGAGTMVCSRCTGIYTGVLFSALIFYFVRIKTTLKINYLFYSAVPMVLDVILYSIGIYHYSIIIAFSSGFLLGSVGFLYFYIGLEKLISEIKNKEPVY